MAVNAPEAGTIKEYLAKEEDTVTVGQDLLKMELGGLSQGGGKQAASQNPKAPASDDQPTSSDPKPSKTDNKPKPVTPPSRPPTSPKKEITEPPNHESPPSPSKHESSLQASPTAKATESKRPEPKVVSSEVSFGSREERRV